MTPFHAFAGRIGICALALAAAAPAAHANILYQFIPISMSTPPGAPYTNDSVVGSFELTDAAFAAGSFTLADVINFSFRVDNATNMTLTPHFDDPILPEAHASIAADGSLFSGRIRHLTTSDFLDMTGDAAGLWSGFFITDNGFFDCDLSNFPCNFTGTWVVAANEPSSVAMFGAACVAAGWMWRRRRAKTDASVRL